MTLPHYQGCEQMVTEPTHIDERGLDFVLVDVPDVVGIRVDTRLLEPRIIVPFL